MLPAVAGFLPALHLALIELSAQWRQPIVVSVPRGAVHPARSPQPSHDAGRAQLGHSLGCHAENRRENALGILTVVGAGAATAVLGSMELVLRSFGVSYDALVFNVSDQFICAR